MPPIMGATAFVMADVTGAGYLAVAKAALLPSLLYYFSLLMMIHFEAVNKNIGITPPTRSPIRAACCGAPTTSCPSSC